MTYSEVVNELQNDEGKAANLLIEIAENQLTHLREIKNLEQQLESENSKYAAQMRTIEHICNHIKKPTPFIIVCDKKVYQFTDSYTVHVSNIDWKLPDRDLY